MWTTLALAFPLLGKWMAWKVGNVQRIRIGVDPWIRCGNNHILSKRIKEKVRQHRITHLADATVLGRDTIWSHGWKEARDVCLEDEEANQWNSLIGKLMENYIHLKDKKDSLVLSWNPSRKYIASIG